MSRNFVACKKKVHNRGIPPSAFLDELVDWANGETFKTETKANHKFAIEYCARLLRLTVKHHGPVRDHHINPWLRRDAVAEFEGFLANED